MKCCLVQTLPEESEWNYSIKIAFLGPYGLLYHRPIHMIEDSKVLSLARFCLMEWNNKELTLEKSLGVIFGRGLTSTSVA